MAKDIVWFHSVIWQALLIAADLPIPNWTFPHGFFTIDGQKMSKSLGNVISPKELVDAYGIDGTRYLLLSSVPFGSDGDLGLSKFTEKYNADLANGLGNLISRVAKMGEGLKFSTTESFEFSPEYSSNLEKFKFNEILETIWDEIRATDKYINEKEPWTITDQKTKTHVLQVAVNVIRKLGFELASFMPETAEKILEQFGQKSIRAAKPYFKRIV